MADDYVMKFPAPEAGWVESRGSEVWLVADSGKTYRLLVTGWEEISASGKANQR